MLLVYECHTRGIVGEQKPTYLCTIKIIKRMKV